MTRVTLKVMRMAGTGTDIKRTSMILALIMTTKKNATDSAMKTAMKMATTMELPTDMTRTVTMMTTNNGVNRHFSIND